MDQGINDVISVPGDKQGDQAGLGWESPRWRHHDVASQGVVELEYRFRNTAAPRQRGAIDDTRTIVGDKASSEGRSWATGHTQESLSPVASRPEIHGERSSATSSTPVRHGAISGDLSPAGP
jgi:hypothetical protein